ncbi:MAG: hypothetical protein KDD82_05460, partial [Planctomycetes bacterium]|nr:hypothetical protein [Planctomycetota bacterium]
MKRLPRIGLLLSSAAQGAEWTSALRRALPEQAWGAALAPTPPGSLPESSFAELERSSEALLAVPCASVADARAALGRGELAALVHVGAPDRSCLWQRGSVRGVEPGARGTAAQVEAAGL